MTATSNVPLLVSADSHVCEPPDLWTRHLGERFGTRVPHVGKNAGSGMYGDYTGKLEGDWFVVEGIPAFPMTFGTAGGYDAEERARRLRRFDFATDARPSVYEPNARVKDMDVDGVAMELIYPSYMPRMLFMRDAELQRACVAVYNDWLAEFCSAAPKRLHPMAVVSLVDAELGAAELTRCAKRGAKGAAIWCTPPAELSFASSHYETFWATAADLGLPVSLHALPPLDTAWSAPRHKSAFVENATMGLIEDFHLANVLFNHHIQRSLAQIILSGVLERHPKLKLVVCEFGTAWLPTFLDNLDGTYLFRPDGLPLKKKPSEYYYGQVWCTFDRELGLAPQHVAALEDRLMWSSDFPHIESSWPRSRDAFTRYCGDLPGDGGPKMGGKNCVALYNLPAG